MTVANTTAMNLKRENTNRGWVFYDGECQLCINAATRFAPMLQRHRFELVPLQSPWTQHRLGLKPGEPLTEMKLLAEDGRIFGGADALLQIAQKVWWAWPLFAFAQLPGAMLLLRANYRWVAANRYCISGQCLIPKNHYYKLNQINKTKL